MNKDNYIYIQDGSRSEVIKLGIFDNFYIEESNNRYAIYGLKVRGDNKPDYYSVLYKTESVDVARSVLERIATIMDAVEINEKGNFKYVGTNAENG